MPKTKQIIRICYAVEITNSEGKNFYVGKDGTHYKKITKCVFEPSELDQAKEIYEHEKNVIALSSTVKLVKVKVIQEL